MVGRKNAHRKVYNDSDFHRAYNSHSGFSAYYQAERSNQHAFAGDTAGKPLAVVVFGFF